MARIANYQFVKSVRNSVLLALVLRSVQLTLRYTPTGFAFASQGATQGLLPVQGDVQQQVVMVSLGNDCNPRLVMPVAL